MIAGPIPEAVEVLRDLKGAGVPCYALTNMEVETYPPRLERFPFLRWFDGSVVSGFERIAKPDTEIFELLLRRFDLTPGSTLLVDDSARNVRAAQRLGMQAVEFGSAAELRCLLEEAGVLGGVG
jgi:2-haloacid dehalogenase